MTDTSDKITACAAFWPYYLRENAKPATRYIHFFGTALGLCFLVLTFTSAGTWWYLLAAVICGYFFAWIGHLFIEHNPPRHLHLSAVVPVQRFPHVLPLADLQPAGGTAEGGGWGMGKLRFTRSFQTGRHGQSP